MALKTVGLVLLVAAASVTTTACASGGSTASASASSAAAEAPPVRCNRDIITRSELADPSMSALSVYDAIRSLRPNFLSSRGGQGLVSDESGKVLASIDGTAVIPVEELKRLHVRSVVEIRLLNPAAAMQKFGGSAKEGPVILVLTM